MLSDSNPSRGLTSGVTMLRRNISSTISLGRISRFGSYVRLGATQVDIWTKQPKYVSASSHDSLASKK